MFPPAPQKSENSLAGMDFYLCFLGWSGTESVITKITTGLVYQSLMMMSVEQ
jgi:hypothetical protein